MSSGFQFKYVYKHFNLNQYHNDSTGKKKLIQKCVWHWRKVCVCVEVKHAINLIF